MKTNMAALKWVFNKIKPKLFHILLITILSVLISVVSVEFALAAKPLIDSAIGTSDVFIKNCIYMGFLVVLQLIVQILYSLVFVKTEGKMKIGLRTEIFNNLLKKDYTDVTKFHTGELLNRIENDAQIITTGVVNIIPNSISLITQIILSLFALYSLDSSLTYICIALLPIMLIAAKFYSKFIKPLHKEYQKTNGISHSFILENLQNLLVLKSFSNEDAVTKHSKELQNNNLNVAVKRNYINLLGNVGFYILLNVGFYFSMVWCVYKISIGIMTFGTLTAVLQLVSNVQSPISSLSGVIPQIFSVIASSERLIELENLNDDKEPKSVSAINFKNITFDNVTFSYGDEEILREASVTINKGEFIAIRGQSGIGKSTFFKLIMAILKPDDGQIKINNSEKLTGLHRSLFSYVPQTNMLLSGTILDNVKFYNKSITKEQVMDALKVACIWDFIKELPEGLDTKLGEKGLGLSEGQIQRIAIARAVAHNAPILLLDEATSALDEMTEKEVLNNLKFLHKTCIVISHRPLVFDICNKILKFEDKKIKED